MPATPATSSTPAPAAEPRRRVPRIIVVILLVLALGALMAVLVIRITGLLATDTSPITGVGDPAEQDRTAGAFTALSVSGNVHVVVAVGGERAVSLTAQRNLLPMIHTDVIEGRLTVTIDAPGIAATKPVTLRVTVPVLTRVSLDGGAAGTMEIESDVLELALNGGSTMTAIGRASALTMTADGGCTAELEELHVETADIKVNGGSTAVLDVSARLTGSADGGSTVQLIQKPATLGVKTSGGATVTGP